MVVRVVRRAPAGDQPLHPQGLLSLHLPAGAALAIPTKLRQFDWLKRRKECGSPCQLCAKECEIQAIHPDGRINANECHYCLDCQMTYHNERKCLPLVMKNKQAKRGGQGQVGIERIPVTSIET